MKKPLNYTDEIDLSWSKTAVNTFQVTPNPDHDPMVLDLDGACPRCKDPMHHSHWLISFSGASAMKRDAALRAAEKLRDEGVTDKPLLPAEFSVKCCCKMPHPDPLGRKDLSGCGAIWKMRFEAVGP